MPPTKYKTRDVRIITEPKTGVGTLALPRFRRLSRKNAPLETCASETRPW